MVLNSNTGFRAGLTKLLVLLLATLATADITTVFRPPFYAGYEERAEAQGYVVTYGTTPWGTAINLSSSTVSGDSSVVAFVVSANDTNNESSGGYKPHRSYVQPQFQGYPIGDSTRQVGKYLQCPCWFQTWYKQFGVTLAVRPGLDDWSSPLTFRASDSGSTSDSVVTLSIDLDNYVQWQHVPTFGLATHTYQITNALDPKGLRKIRNSTWHLIQTFYDPKNLHRASVWVDGVLHSSANITGRHNVIGNWHAGMYLSAAVASGTVWNDETWLTTVRDSLDGIRRFMAFPPGR